jgi:hypothetical protein
VDSPNGAAERRAAIERLRNAVRGNATGAVAARVASEEGMRPPAMSTVMRDAAPVTHLHDPRVLRALRSRKQRSRARDLALVVDSASRADVRGELGAFDAPTGHARTFPSERCSHETIAIRPQAVGA